MHTNKKSKDIKFRIISYGTLQSILRAYKIKLSAEFENI